MSTDTPTSSNSTPRRLEGVEQNPESRYVDYTKATDWEEFSYHISSALKKPQSIPIDGLEFKYIENIVKLYYCSRDDEIGSMIPGSPDYLDWFGIPRYMSLLLSESTQSLKTESERRIIYSAAVTGVSSAYKSGLGDIPVFFKGTKSDNVHGYAIVSDPEASPESSRNILVHKYYSSVITEMPSSDPLCYVDGLLKLFHDEVCGVTGITWDLRNCLPVGVTVTEWHRTSSDAYCKVNDTYLNMMMRSMKVKPAVVTLSDDVNGTTGTSTSTGTVATTTNMAVHPLVENVLADLWTSCQREMITEGLPPDIYVRMIWNNIGHQSLVDNIHMTNLQPHVLDNIEWFATCMFEKNKNDDGVSDSGLVNGMKRLVSLFVTEVLQEESMYRRPNGQGWRNESVLSSLDSMHPAPFSTKMKEFISKMNKMSGNFNETLHDEALMHLFATPLFVAAADVENSSIHIAWDVTPDEMWNWMNNTIPIGSFLSLFSLCMAGQVNIDGMTQLWKSSLIQIRGLWEKSIPIARLSQPITIQDRHYSDEMMAKSNKNRNSDSYSFRESGSTSFDVLDKDIESDRESLNSSIIQPLKVQDRLLWSDCASNIRKKGLGLPFPLHNDNTTSSKLFNQLRRLGICILCKETKSFVYPDVDIDVDRNSVDSSDKSVRPYKIPMLMRRIPIEDMSITQDIIRSDIQSFKATNPLCTFEDFCQFYQGNAFNDTSTGRNEDKTGEVKVSNTDTALWQEIWNSCSAVAVEDQPPLFDVDSLADEALTYIENLTSSSVAKELLVAFIASSNFMLNQGIYKKQLNTYTLINKELEMFDSECHDALSKLHSAPTVRKSAHGDIDLEPLRDVFVALNALTDRIIRISNILDKYERLGAFGQQYTRLAVDLAVKGTSVPETDDERIALLELVRRGSTEDYVHPWHSSSRRELDSPYRKKMDLIYPIGGDWRRQHRLTSIRDDDDNVRISMRIIS
jgi:hypothetical protein